MKVWHCTCIMDEDCSKCTCCGEENNLSLDGLIDKYYPKLAEGDAELKKLKQKSMALTNTAEQEESIRDIDRRGAEALLGSMRFKFKVAIATAALGQRSSGPLATAGAREGCDAPQQERPRRQGVHDAA